MDLSQFELLIEPDDEWHVFDPNGEVVMKIPAELAPTQDKVNAILNLIQEWYERGIQKGLEDAKTSSL